MFFFIGQGSALGEARKGPGMLENPLGLTGVIATILSVIFASAAFFNSSRLKGLSAPAPNEPAAAHMVSAPAPAAPHVPTFRQFGPATRQPPRLAGRMTVSYVWE